MPPTDPAVLAERLSAVERQLLRVSDQLPVLSQNLVVHGYADLDLRRVHEAARTGPADVRGFAARLLRAEGLDNS